MGGVIQRKEWVGSYKGRSGWGVNVGHQLPGATSPSKGSSLPSPEVLITSDLTQKTA